MNSIPVIIINMNRVSTLEKLVDQLLILGYFDIFIFDMGSTYPPLIDYYRQNEGVRFSLLEHQNRGHKCFWTDSVIDLFKDYPWIAVTDSDIELNIDTPAGFIEKMIAIAQLYNKDKAGLAIEYEDISNPFLKQIIEPIERNYWKKAMPIDWSNSKQGVIYIAPVDTSFCVVRTDKPFQYDALRVPDEFTCRHIPWYVNFSELSEEEAYFLEHADEKISTYKQHYLNWLKTNSI